MEYKRPFKQRISEQIEIIKGYLSEDFSGTISALSPTPTLSVGVVSITGDSKKDKNNKKQKELKL